MNQSKNYDAGKKNERDSFGILKEKGYVRPTAKQKRFIKSAFESVGKDIKPRGYDLIHESALPWVLSEKLAKDHVDKLVLYELKTAGANRETPLKEDFRGLGFTLSGSEKYNAEKLGEQYKFVFLDLATENLKVSRMEEWFNSDASRIYPTYSIFIK